MTHRKVNVELTEFENGDLLLGVSLGYYFVKSIKDKRIKLHSAEKMKQLYKYYN